ncbi:hypothetical protein Q8W71_27270 [Methylobacterium sp. NEAU 140]|uniref:hypothetical protein n=1 Tax=Methylobacterium sp. NEAU 140 TaxID=3064945 RepID=UPI002732B3E8|nr:hypothetical protein [Methylobacterium sp. NEAU 140]MDP4026329.1 hypothetical protein [Methylobacterium sp. NEAU 140]
MIDLFALFQEAHEQHEAPADPGFPVLDRDQPERQAADCKDISGISGISGRQKQAHANPEIRNVQACAGARASGRARGVYAGTPEIPETPEKPAPAEGYLSGSLLRNPEKERETGKVGPLPAVDGLALWRAGLARLDPARPPCPGYRINDRTGAQSGEWSRVLARAVAFLNEFGEQAEALGWTAPRLFGAHAEAGIVRVDACGALALPIGGAVRAITATEISFGHLTYREKPGQPEGLPWWEFGR